MEGTEGTEESQILLEIFPYCLNVLVCHGCGAEVSGVVTDPGRFIASKLRGFVAPLYNPPQ